MSKRNKSRAKIDIFDIMPRAFAVLVFISLASSLILIEGDISNKVLRQNLHKNVNVGQNPQEIDCSEKLAQKDRSQIASIIDGKQKLTNDCLFMSCSSFF